MQKTAFIFDEVALSPLRQIGRHSHAMWELSLVTCGSGTRTIGDHTENIQQGETILIPPLIPHIWQFDPAVTDADGNISNISVFFGTQLLDTLELAIPELQEVLSAIKEQTEAIAYTGETRDGIQKLLYSMRGMAADARVPHMVQLLRLISDTAACQRVGRNKPSGKIELRLEKIRVYCACNYMRNITLEEVAAHVGMNKSAFCTFFRRHAGTTLSEYVNDMRLERARERIIHTDGTIAEIAFDCGFSSVTYFNRLFRAKYNSTPRSLRTEL